jgi:hypothetical protein
MMTMISLSVLQGMMAAPGLSQRMASTLMATGRVFWDETNSSVLLLVLGKK